MTEKIIEMEAETLEEARAQVKSQIPEGLHLLSEQVLSDGKPKTVKATADTTESAFAKAQSEIPTNATNLEKKELSAPAQRVITVQAFDERGVASEARRRLGEATVVKGLKLTVAGKKGFLGIGKTPNRYEAEVFQQAVVEITYKGKARISAKIGAKPPTFVRKDVRADSVYEIYRGTDAQSAKAFLTAKKVNKQYHYIVVETPEGNWGTDIQGLYLERLCPWQTNLTLAECEGVVQPYSTFGLQMAARGLNDNFIAKVLCGKCEHSWLDGIRYKNMTVVRCPNCRAYNKVDSERIEVWFV